jgi:glycosyltransferase involved in cell wall biosynthesis
MLRGHLDIVTRRRIAGWAWDSDEPDTPISIIVTADDEVIGRVLANRFRSDLKAGGVGNGRFSFDLRPTTILRPNRRYMICARRETTGAHLNGSHAVLEASTAFDREMEGDITAILSAVDTDDDLERRLAFLARQTDTLLQTHADRRSGVHEREARRRQRWGTAAASNEPPQRPRALVIDEKMPQAERDAGSVAILSHMRSLQRFGFDVSFASSDLDHRGGHLEALGIACCARPWASSIEDILSREAASFQLVYLHRGTVAGRYAALVRHHQRKTRLVYSVADLHFLRLARQAAVEERPELAAHGRYFQTVELTAAWYADAVITHSSFEGALLAKRLPAEKIHVVPWSIPVTPPTVPFADRRGMAFIGGYSHQPNVDAARWLVSVLVPQFAARGLDAPVLLVGSNMPDSLRQSAGGVVEAVGQVGSLAEVFDRVRVTVAPLAFGAGIKGKVLDSLAAGIPCVCTPAAAEGLDLPPLLLEQVASDAATLADKIKRLHDDEALNAACSTAGLAYVQAFASEERLDSLMRKVVGTAARPLS